MNQRSCPALFVATLLASVAPLSANLVITPTFGSSITSDPNAAGIEGAINAAIHIYENTFSNPINVPITFQECGSGCLGQSSFSLFDVSYLQFSTQLSADAKDPNQFAAVAKNPPAATNPVTGTSDILMKCAAIDVVFGAGSSGCASDGTISLNTHLTTPGSPGTSSTYYLQAVAEHEIDEILGLGSTLGLGLGVYSCTNGPCSNVPSPEDLFRYSSNGLRSFTMSSSAQAFFSINGTVDLAQFDNQNDGGDFGDWQSNPLPPGVSPHVQDAFATAGADPALGVEITALNVIGYDLVAPEPATAIPVVIALGGLIGFARGRRSCQRGVQRNPVPR